MSIVAMAIAISKGWQLFLATLLIAPLWFFACTLLVKISIAGYMESMMAYNQSAGYAEQALAAIRVVVSFGFEKQEVKNYTKYLDQVHAAGCK
jgi:ABC-type multidrug transport system fused ATPase/permease subunit